MPLSDVRFRGDLRAFEYGDMDLASKEKKRLEEEQRARRRQRKREGVRWKPKWFELYEEEGREMARFNGLYWKAKELQLWSERHF